MPQSLANVLVHIIFATKHRHPFLQDRVVREEVHSYIGGSCNNLGCRTIAVGGIADHIHIFCALSRILTIADAVREIKIGSSKWIKSKGGMLTKFGWQDGYAVYSVGRDGVDRLVQYIRNQEEHHRIRCFREEVLRFLKENEIEYDERYLWE